MTSNSAISSKSNRTNKSQLGDAETTILMGAANREDGIALPVPESITASAEQVARKIKRLIKLSLGDRARARLFFSRQFRKHVVAGDLIWEIAAVSEQDDAGFVCWHEADIG